MTVSGFKYIDGLAKSVIALITTMTAAMFYQPESLNSKKYRKRDAKLLLKKARRDARIWRNL